MRKPAVIGPAVRSYRSVARLSYGDITPERFAEIVRCEGPEPSAGERARVHQGLTERDPRPRYGTGAAELAAELDMSLDELEARCLEMFGVPLGSVAFGYEPDWRTISFEELDARFQAAQKTPPIPWYEDWAVLVLRAGTTSSPLPFGISAWTDPKLR